MDRQQEFWTPTVSLSTRPGHVFYEKLSQVLSTASFNIIVEELCRPYYAWTGRSSILPGVYFRMLIIGYREWLSPTDPASRIVKMKDGRTRLGCKAEHVVDLENETSSRSRRITEQRVVRARC